MGKEAVYVVFQGNICTGKDTLINALKERGVLAKLIREDIGESVHFQSEAVNHDKEVLGNYYGDMLKTTEFFEIGSLCSRAILSGAINKKKGIVIGNRHVFEARHTFVINSSMMHSDDGKKFLDETGVGIYDLLLRRAVEKGLIPMPDIVFFLYVDNPDVLIERNKKRADSGEKSIKPEYLKLISNHFDNYRKNFEKIYRYMWNVEPPKIIELNTTGNIESDSKLINYWADLCEREIEKVYREKILGEGE